MRYELSDYEWTAKVWDLIMDALAAGHDAAMQMIDTSVARVHQLGIAPILSVLSKKPFTSVG